MRTATISSPILGKRSIFSPALEDNRDRAGSENLKNNIMS